MWLSGKYFKDNRIVKAFGCGTAEIETLKNNPGRYIEKFELYDGDSIRDIEDKKLYRVKLSIELIEEGN